jgi:hypothetical protein
MTLEVRLMQVVNETVNTYTYFDSETDASDPYGRTYEFIKKEYLDDILSTYAALLAACEAVLNSDMAQREEDEGNVSAVLSVVRAALAKAGAL